MWLLDELEKRKNCEDIAIYHREVKLSFKDLWRKSESLAVWMESELKTKRPVVIYGNKDVEILIAMVAALKTGRAYVPLDITFPLRRVKEIIKETEAEVIFNYTCEDIVDIVSINKNKLESIFIEKQGRNIDKLVSVKEDENCYILFTSGSTGKPKGVQITKKNIMNFVNWFSKICVLPSNRQIVLNQVSYSFDVSVIAIYIYLAMGKTLYSIDKLMMDNLKELFEYLKESNIAAWVSTPTFLEICSFDEKFDCQMLKELELIILAGEILSKRLVESIKDKFPNIKIINGYGPTEGTVLLSACEITQEMLNDIKCLPIGKILADGKYKILKDGKEVKEGECGELVVVSDSISNGYFNNKEQTEKVFFNDESGRRGYYTGDIVFEENGLLYYVTRKDTQIKLNGFRVELTDISNNLNKIDNVSNSTVIPVYKEGRVSYLVAFVMLKEQKNLSEMKQGIEIKKELRKLIPSYMVPRKVVIVEQFPMNTNGKVDKKKLEEEYLK